MTKLPSFVTVGSYSSIAKGVRFHSLSEEHQYSVNHKAVYTTRWEQPFGTGSITIGNDVWIGEGVRILPNTIIEDGCVIGAGAVIKGTFPTFAIVVGNPGKVIKYRFTTEQQEKLKKIQWWNWKGLPETINIEDFKDIDRFIKKYE